MKYGRKSIKVIPIILMLFGILTTTVLAYPVSNVTMYVVDGTDSYFLTTLSGIPAGEDLSDGTYPGWCVETGDTLPRSTNHIVTLYSSLNPPASLASEAWDMVNYILNHKQGGRIDIQAAIWYFVKMESPTPGYYTYDPYGDNRYGGNPSSADTQAMVAAALAEGGGFTPGPCDVLAVICLPDDYCIQISIVELQIPCLRPGFTPGFWKHNIRVALGYPGNYSSFDNSGDHLTYSEVLGYVEATGLWGTGTSALEGALADLTAKGPGSVIIRRNAANALNHVAGYGDYED